MDTAIRKSLWLSFLVTARNLKKARRNLYYDVATEKKSLRSLLEEAHDPKRGNLPARDLVRMARIYLGVCRA